MKDLENTDIKHVKCYTLTTCPNLNVTNTAMTNDVEYYINEVEIDGRSKFVDLNIGICTETKEGIMNFFEQNYGDLYLTKIIDYVRDEFKFEVADMDFTDIKDEFKNLINEDELLSLSYLDNIYDNDKIKAEFSKIYVVSNPSFIVENFSQFDSDITNTLDYDDISDIPILTKICKKLESNIFKDTDKEQEILKVKDDYMMECDI